MGTCRSDAEGSRGTSREVAEEFAGSQGKATVGEARWKWLEGEPRVSVMGLLEQGPAATEEAASFGRKKLRQSYDVVARFQLESRAENHDF